MRVIEKIYNVPLVYTSYFSNGIQPVLFLDKDMFPYHETSDFIPDYGVNEILVDNKRYVVMLVEESAKYFIFVLKEIE